MSLNLELIRKLLHFSLVWVPIFFCFAGRTTSLVTFAIITGIIVSLDCLRKKAPMLKSSINGILKPVLRPHEIEGSKLSGASWVGIAACVNFLIFPKEIAVTSFAVMVICDGLAAIIGKVFPSRPFFEKSLSGALGFFISGIVVLITCGLILNVEFWFYLFALIALAAATIIESRPSLINIDDNFTIPISFSLVMSFFYLVWL